MFLNCENPIDNNSTNDIVLVDECNLYEVDLTCADANSCQWINEQCISMNSALCILNYGGIIDDCGICSSGSTGIMPNKDKNICGECFIDEPTDSSVLVFYNHDNNENTPELFCGCNNFNSSILNNGCCGIIGSYNFFKENNIECNPDNQNSSNCINMAERDECGVCEGGNISCLDCNDEINGTAILDECGECNGTGINEEECDCDGNIIDECGECNGTGINEGECDCSGNILDCLGTCGGSAIIDCDGNCNETNNFPDNSCDCNGNVIDECGECNGNGINEGECDCDGNILDCLGICAGDGSIDCEGVCNGVGVDIDLDAICDNIDDCIGTYDDCGICNGPGITEGTCECNGTGINEGECDCSGNILDCQLVCGGTAELDDCGICNGENIKKDICNVCFGDDSECLQGILTLNDWHFDFKSTWNNNECIGPVHYDYYNYVCIDQTCYDYKLTFNEDYSFQFLVEYWNIDSDCDWLLDKESCSPNYDFSNIGFWSVSINQVFPLIINGNILCLDFENEELEDFCFDEINLLNSYEDCIMDSNNCNDNILYLSQSNQDECYRDQYSSTNYTYNNSTINYNIDFDNAPVIYKNIIKSILHTSMSK